MVTRDSIVAAARSWIDVPWRHQGRSRDGVDCVGLVVEVARGLGLAAYDLYGYSRRPTDVALLAHFHRAGLRERCVADARPGDVLVMREGRFPCHVGFVTDHARRGRCLLHAAAGRRGVVEEPLSAIEAAIGGARPVACFAFPGVED